MSNEPDRQISDGAGPRVAAILVAAGRGTRMGADLPKQYLEVGGRSILRRTVDRFLAVGRISRVIVVIHPEDDDAYGQAVGDIQNPKLGQPVAGGDSRAASVAAGLEALVSDKPEIVLIHDAARPFCPVRVIDDVIAGCLDADGAFAALPVVDALWSVDGDLAQRAVSRDGLWRAQTPQGFRFEKILAAHRADTAKASADDVAVARHAGLTVRVVPGDAINFKITTAADLDRARRVFASDGDE